MYSFSKHLSNYFWLQVAFDNYTLLLPNYIAVSLKVIMVEEATFLPAQDLSPMVENMWVFSPLPTSSTGHVPFLTPQLSVLESVNS